ncbi:RBBP9/YdeN family alpha/beta hydrolase [Staphylococcus auricularis]|uniref:RBBP9/YdeN family alpha/beta hydrolase n=1 Tax=Staphylococcus auricularis TaxID=29379 RepID=UPI00242DA2E1|nr:alpha/beta hydrolase [Staphylococcus auricularis]
MKKMFIVHGYQATSSSHWYQWLTDEMEAYGYETEVVALPDTNQPDYKSWSATLQHLIQEQLDSETIIVAHSLGVITTLDFLTNLPQIHHIKGLFLVAGFGQTLTDLPELNTFIDQCHIQYPRLSAERIMSIAASDDPVVDIAYTDELSQSLKVPTTIIEHNGHFLARDGYDRFDRLKSYIVGLIKQNNSEIGK